MFSWHSNNGYFGSTDIGNITYPEMDPWNLKDFKNAILKNGETIFYPFTSGLLTDGSVNLATDENVQLPRTESMSIGMTDCWGILDKLEKDKFVFRSAIAWGGMNHSIEPHSLPKIDKAINRFTESFQK